MVKNEYGKIKKMLICPPENLCIDEPINVIAARHNQSGEVNIERAKEEHEEFSFCLRENGIQVIKPKTYKRFSYQINVRDLGVTTAKGIILGRLLKPERWGEHRPVEEIFLEKKVPVFHKMDRGIFEGGDFMFLDENTALVGIGARTDWLGFKVLETLLYDAGIDLVPVDFPAEYLHLDMICNVIAEKVVLVCPEALPVSLFQLLRQKKFAFIEVEREEVFQHACNLLNIGEEKIISHPGAERVNELLKSLGMELFVLPLHEVRKSGGGPRCMSSPIERN